MKRIKKLIYSKNNGYGINHQDTEHKETRSSRISGISKARENNKIKLIKRLLSKPERWTN